MIKLTQFDVISFNSLSKKYYFEHFNLFYLISFDFLLDFFFLCCNLVLISKMSFFNIYPINFILTLKILKYH